MSDKGIILFHDTNVRKRDFGVFELWNEVSETYLNFEFFHSYGLGVLGVGDSKFYPEEIKNLFNLTVEEASFIREKFVQIALEIETLAF